jgi:hypothetical protein
MLSGKAYYHTYKSKANITISTSVWQDSAWPFKNGDDIKAEIDGDRVVLSKVLKGQKKLTEEHV